MPKPVRRPEQPLGKIPARSKISGIGLKEQDGFRFKDPERAGI